MTPAFLPAPPVPTALPVLRRANATAVVPATDSRVPRHVAFVPDASRHADSAAVLATLRRLLAACREQRVECVSVFLPAADQECRRVALSEAARMRVKLQIAAGGRAELVQAMLRLAADAAAGTVTADEITPQRLAEYLPSHDLPPVDLLIRTGGVTRLSDFLLWQAAYAELLFVGVPWASFGRDDFRAALDDYARRRRTFGALPEPGR
jgi:undecaprenyl pyrophosphate synthase